MSNNLPKTKKLYYSVIIIMMSNFSVWLLELMPY